MINPHDQDPEHNESMAFHQRFRRTRARWTIAEPGMATGTVDDTIIGHVIDTHGGYIAFNAVPAPLGLFASVASARKAAESASSAT